VRKDPRTPLRHRAQHEDGFTIIEVMVGMMMLIVGVLGMLIMIQGSLRSTSRTMAREQATNLARDVLERSREVDYASTTTDAAPAAIAAVMPETPSVSGTSFVVRRRNINYTVTITASSIDSPADGVGIGNAKFCDAPTHSTGPGSPPTGTGLAIGPNILGLPLSVAVGGSLVTTVCNAVGTDTAIAGAISDLSTSLLAAQGNGAVLSACPAASGGSIAFDTLPDDLRRIRAKIDWTQGGTARTLTQTTLLTSPT
jgi:type II secretory pathway pseudopilin PulG